MGQAKILRSPRSDMTSEIESQDSGIVKADVTITLDIRLPNQTRLERSIFDYVGTLPGNATDTTDRRSSQGGCLVLYPASSLHQTPAVTAGMRVASSFWGQSMIRDAHARNMIFDLDSAVQSLVEHPGRNDPETVKSTGIHHNLIRYWAEV